MSKVLGEIIDETQTAYVGGRLVADNLRIFKFLQYHFMEEKLDAVLISLDAKKELLTQWTMDTLR